MKIQEGGRFVLGVSVPLAGLLTVTAWAGLFWPSTYAQEKPLWAAEGMGGDAVNLFVIVPVLLASALLAQRGSASARLIWMGTLTCILYNSVIYALGVHFNALFLVYCGVLGLSFYGLVGSLGSLPVSEIARAYGPRAPVKIMAAVLFLMAVVPAAQWLREIIPAQLAGRAPASVTDVGLPTNPVYVLDLALLLPGLFIAAVMLLRRKALAFTLAPVLLVFLILMSLALAGMLVGMVLKGFVNGYFQPALFVGLAAGFAVLLARYFRGESA